MKNIFYIFMILAGFSGMFTGCSENEEIASPKGVLGVSVATDRIHHVVSTRSTGPDVNTFPVEIWEKGILFKKFDSFQDLKNSGTLRVEVGKTYVIKAHQPGEIPEIGDISYYGGESDSLVVREGFNPVSVVCRMQNVKVTLLLAQELLDKIEDDYTVKISNGTNEGIWTLNATDFNAITHQSSVKYFKSNGSLAVTFSGNSHEYDPAEPFSIEQTIQVAPNDDVKITIGVKKDAVKKTSCRLLNVKMTVEK